MAGCLARVLGGGSSAVNRLTPLAFITTHHINNIIPQTLIKQQNASQLLHTSAVDQAWGTYGTPSRFLKYNKEVYPPTEPGEEDRPAFICHQKTNIKYSPDKMWYVACLVRGLKIDEAISQLKFVHKKGASFARETLEEARTLAVEEHGVEFPSNLWVSESFVSKGIIFRGYRRHARRRFGKVEYKHCHYHVTLEEGEPPEHYYYYRRPLTPKQHIEEWLHEQRQRNIPRSL